MALLSNLDANFTLDGAEMTRGTNTITDALDGVTLKLKGLPTSTDSVTTTLTVGLNTTNLQSAVNTFITDFNDLYGYVKEQTSVDSDGTAKTFSSDQTILNLRVNLQSLLFQTVDAAGANTNNLAKIGITQARDGTISISDIERLTMCWKIIRKLLLIFLAMPVHQAPTVLQCR